MEVKIFLLSYGTDEIENNEENYRRIEIDPKYISMKIEKKNEKLIWE